MNKYLAPKVQELFDILENDMEVQDYEHAEIILARLSRYFHLFDDEHIDYYQYAQETVEYNSIDDEDWYESELEVTEFEEWYDFDPDC
jgi:hypothetical protein